MSILQELKYRFVLDRIETSESYDKDRNVISAKEAFYLCKERFTLVDEALLPLKEKLGNDIIITDILFPDGMQDETCILVKYMRDDKNNSLSISNTDSQVSGMSSDPIITNSDFIEQNKGLIIKTCRIIRTNFLNQEMSFKSTSGKFMFNDNCNRFQISANENKILTLETGYYNYKKTNSLDSSSKLDSTFPKLMEVLEQEGNVSSLYDNLRIYEEDIPKQLIKKIN